jgi:hypothetical protein
MVRCGAELYHFKAFCFGHPSAVKWFAVHKDGLATVFHIRQVQEHGRKSVIQIGKYTASSSSSSINFLELSDQIRNWA